MYTFAIATPIIDILQFHFKHSGLNKPGGAGSFLFGGCQVGVAAPHWAFCIHTKTRRHYARTQAPALSGNSAPCRTAGHLIPQPYTCATHGRRYTAAPSGVFATNAANRKQDPVFRRAVITPNLLIFRNLSCAFTR